MQVPPKNVELSPELQSLLGVLLNRERDRITAKQALVHPWMKRGRKHIAQGTSNKRRNSELSRLQTVLVSSAAGSTSNTPLQGNNAKRRRECAGGALTPPIGRSVVARSDVSSSNSSSSGTPATLPITRSQSRTRLQASREREE
jgi:serine/threonine protein kinase